MPDNKVFVILDDELQNAAKNALFRFSDDAATGIRDMAPAVEKSGDVIYDLQGRKVEKTTRGVYIVNGKKLLVK